MRYHIIIQPQPDPRTPDKVQPQHWSFMPAAGDADAFARWAHRTTGAAASVYDERRQRERLTLGDFDRTRC